jgi:hypothetical protein
VIFPALSHASSAATGQLSPGEARDADQASLAFLVSLGAPQPQHDPVRLIGLHIGDVEPDELGATKRANEPDEQEG